MSFDLISTSNQVQVQLNRLAPIRPGPAAFGLERIAELAERLGNPQLRLPNVLHVAGTNGKGSTCAVLRAVLEAAGHSTHVYTSPHLVAINERIRLAGELISDAHLAELLEEVIDANVQIEASLFEVITCAAFLAFARTPASACVVEVGLGGRLDATNIVPPPLVAAITQLGYDHTEYLGTTLEQIASEKAGIAKPGSVLVTQRYTGSVASTVERAAKLVGAKWLPRGSTWDWDEQTDGALHYWDAKGELILPKPFLLGSHQFENAALAMAALRHQDEVRLSDQAFSLGTQNVRWPGRLQELRKGPLTETISNDTRVWLDVCHNPLGAEVVSRFLEKSLTGKNLGVVIAIVGNKDAVGMLAPLAKHISQLRAVPIPGHKHHDPAELVRIAKGLGIEAQVASDYLHALKSLDADPAISTVMFLVSQYLAGQILASNQETVC